MFSFMESSLLTIINKFSFFWSLNCTRLVILDDLIFLGNVDIGGYLLIAYFEGRILTLGHFPDAFFLAVSYTSQACI